MHTSKQSRLGVVQAQCIGARPCVSGIVKSPPHCSNKFSAILLES